MMNPIACRDEISEMKAIDKLDLNVSNYWSTLKLIFFSFLATIFSDSLRDITWYQIPISVKLLSCNFRLSYEKIIVDLWGGEIKNITKEN